MDQVWKNIVGLDLKSVRNKFAAKKSWWWHLNHKPQQIENEYRQFLYLLVSNPEKTLVPWSADVNEFWREHILDTKRYAADCYTIAGRLINHDPHLVEGSAAHALAFAETRKLYLASFGESARRRRRAAGDTDWGSDATQVFSDHGGHAAHSHHAGHHHAAHHSSGHHDAGQHASTSHGGGGHSSCGGHSGCGGHGHGATLSPGCPSGTKVFDDASRRRSI
jgi:hypothetical protein